MLVPVVGTRDGSDLPPDVALMLASDVALILAQKVGLKLTQMVVLRHRWRHTHFSSFATYCFSYF